MKSTHNLIFDNVFKKVKLLVNVGADTLTIHKQGKTPAQIASEKGNQNFVDILENTDNTRGSPS